jgi:hypothetical protein
MAPESAAMQDRSSEQALSTDFEDASLTPAALGANSEVPVTAAEDEAFEVATMLNAFRRSPLRCRSSSRAVG